MYLKIPQELSVKIRPSLGMWLHDGRPTLEAGGIRRLGSLMCLGCGWWADTAMFSTVMLGSCRSLFTVEVLLSLGADSRSFTWEGKDSNPGGGTVTAWVCCCCRWLSWLRTGDGSGWDLKSKKVGGWGATINHLGTWAHSSLFHQHWCWRVAVITSFSQPSSSWIPNVVCACVYNV